MHVLVTGGTGVVGRPTVDRLLKRGHTVRLLSRHAERDAGDWPDGVEPFAASVGDEAAVRGAAAGCDAVLHIAGIVAEDPPEVTFQRVNVDGTRHLLDEAARAGAPRFVFVSSLGADRGESGYHRSKREAEALVRGYAGSWLILRPGNVYGPGDHVFSLLLKAVRVLPAVPVIGSGDQPFQPIWMEDLAEALVRAVEEAEPARVALDVAGAEVTTTDGVLEQLAELTGRRPARIPIPQWVAETGTGLAEALGVDTPVHTDQLIMLEEENVIDPARPNALTDVFHIRPTPLAEGLARLADELPERLPVEGTGQLHRHRYWVDIQNCRTSPEALLEQVRREFPTLPDPRLLRVATEPGSTGVLDEGETVTLSIPVRGTIQVRVEEVAPREVTAVTLEGHPLSGTIRFLADDVQGGVRFEIRTYTRPSSLLDRIAMETLGEPVKNALWRSVVEAVLRRSGGEAAEGVQSEVQVLDDQAVDDLEQWVERLVRRREQREAQAERA